jgi:predicted nucleic acid-binding protein
LILKTEGKIDHKQLKALISGIATFVTRVKIVRPVKKLSICRDVKDNMILECCVAGGADQEIKTFWICWIYPLN